MICKHKNRPFITETVLSKKRTGFKNLSIQMSRNKIPAVNLSGKFRISVITVLVKFHYRQRHNLWGRYWQYNDEKEDSDDREEHSYWKGH